MFVSAFFFLSACIRSLQEGPSPCSDTSPHLQPFCEILEMILRKGIKREWVAFVPWVGIL